MIAAPRHSRPGDEAGLKTLWKAVFGDAEDFIDAFFALVYQPGMASLIEEGGEIVSAAYAIPLKNAIYIYGVATLPAFRGRGFGKAVTLAAAGGGPAYLFPAEAGLRDWYAREMGAVTVSWRPCIAVPETQRRITAGEYATAREVLLKNVPHAVYPLSVLRWFEADGGRFYRCGAGICASDSGGVKEVLPGMTGGDYVMGINGAPPLYFGLVLD